MINVDKLLSQLYCSNIEFKRLEEYIDYEQPSKYIVKSTQYNDEYDIASGKEKINTFFGFVKKALINLKNFKDVVYQTMVKKDQEIENYLTLIHVFEDYEKYTLMEYANNDENKLVFFNPKNIELCEKIMSLKRFQQVS